MKTRLLPFTDEQASRTSAFALNELGLHTNQKIIIYDTERKTAVHLMKVAPK